MDIGNGHSQVRDFRDSQKEKELLFYKKWIFTCFIIVWPALIFTKAPSPKEGAKNIFNNKEQEFSKRKRIILYLEENI